MGKSVFGWVLIAACWLLLLPHAYAKTLLKKIEAEDSGDVSVLSIHLNEMRDYSTFMLDNPARLVVDISGAANGKPSKSKVDNRSSAIASIRTGKPEKGKVRTVLDLNTPVSLLDSFFIQPEAPNDPYQLVIRFKPINALMLGGIVPAAGSAEAGQKPASKPSNADKNLPASMRSTYTNRSPFAHPVEIRAKPEDTDRPAATASEKTKPAPTVTAAAKNYKPIIVIDAGHGGMDPGAISPGGLKEKDVTLRYAKALKEALLATGRYRVALTRSKDAFIPLGKRVVMARKAQGDIFISIHADSHPNRKTQGFSVYTLSESRAQYEAKKLERKADKEEVIRGVDLSKESEDVQSVLIRMAQRETKNTSATFAEILVKHMGKRAKLLRRTHRHKSLAVLTGADIPSVLIELGYLSNAYEAGLLTKDSHREKIVTGVIKALDEYYNY